MAEETEIQGIDFSKVPDGLTALDWEELSQTEKEAYYDKDTIDDYTEKPVESIDEATLAEIAGEEEAEKTEEIVSQGTDEKKVVEEKVEAPVITEADLLSYRPAIDRTKFVVPEITASAELTTKLEELEKKYDDGDIQIKEYNRERDAINRQITMKIYASAESAKETWIADQTWKSEQREFFKYRPEYDLKDPRGKMLYGALNQTIKELDADPANNGKSGMAILLAADKHVKTALGITSAKKEEPKVKEKSELERTTEEKPAAKDAVKKDLDASLTEVPQSGQMSVGGWMEELDAKRGQEYEDALEKLPQERKDQYLAMASRR
jgi:hypothetical protein